jgi:hypothetical protein
MIDFIAVQFQNDASLEEPMATLNVKNLPDKLYARLRQRARAHHRSAAQEVTCILEAALEDAEPLSLQELRGLGKPYWNRIDAAAHVERERNTWD